jgi:Polyketide cyclase / dehydrase and lipid transport
MLDRVLQAWTSISLTATVCVLSTVAGLANAGTAELAAGWQLRATDELNNIEVYTRTRPDQHREFLGVTTLTARLSTVAAVLQDTAAMPRWLHRVREVQELETPEPTRGLLRLVTNLPWPLRDREVAVQWRMTQDDSDGVVEVRGVGVLSTTPAREGLVRMPAFESTWRVKPLPGGQVEVRLTGYGHMGGNLDHPAMRAFLSSSIWQAPLESLKGLRGMVQLPAYSQARVSAVREAP